MTDEFPKVRLPKQEPPSPPPTKYERLRGMTKGKTIDDVVALEYPEIMADEGVKFVFKDGSSVILTSCSCCEGIDVLDGGKHR